MNVLQKCLSKMSPNGKDLNIYHSSVQKLRACVRVCVKQSSGVSIYLMDT